ncbi:MAG: phage major capsid protein, partial [Pseudomonadota bacterium]
SISASIAEAASRRMDRAAFLGAGGSGEPAGIVADAAGYGITETDVAAEATYALFRDAAIRFMTSNAAAGPGAVRALIRPETYGWLDASLVTGTDTSEMDRVIRAFGNVVMSPNALAAPSGSPAEAKAVLTTSAGGVSPFFVATWGAIDVVRDPFSDAASGGLRLTMLATMDIAVARPAQIEIIDGLQGPAA